MRSTGRFALISFPAIFKHWRVEPWTLQRRRFLDPLFSFRQPTRLQKPLIVPAKKDPLVVVRHWIATRRPTNFFSLGNMKKSLLHS